MAANDKNLPGAYLDPAPSTYGQQMSNVGGALLGLLGNAGRFLVSAPGSGSPFAAGNAPSVPANTVANAAALTQADAPSVPAVTAAVPAAKPATAPTASTPGSGTPKAAAAPKGPALIPGETGYYNENNQLVPYGVNLAAGAGPAPGAAGTPLKGLPAGSANLIDPRSFFPSAVDTQMEYARQAANSILNMAGDGSQLGYSARLRALSAIFNNGLAQTGQSGANTFNSNVAGMVGSQLSADAQRAVAGTQAGIASADRALAREDMMTRFYSTPVTVGSELVKDPLTGLSVPRPQYGVPQRGGGFATIGDTGGATKPKEGATGKTPDGRAVVYKNGAWTEK